MGEISNSWNELETNIKELVVAVHALAGCEAGGLNPGAEASTAPTQLLEPASGIQLAKRRVTAVLNRLQSLLTEPGDFIQRLAYHVRSICFLNSL